ncbi:sulfite exporter TauE/SafE family protein [Massilia solisilvae]|uniref:Probable membrane transporter protein n=1 Tax=Massilia solisilvae TaxID=1811225 RepID=A0ABT2BKQ8_9BURK|nr:sulfite exporter TauE/SafE family protein [Massilia solisilvae]MCS0609096.1 sulfite exporter TauE/SafE family protein [Massilia solisilvae]
MAFGIETVVLLALIVMLAYTVFGLTGFGSSITAMPMLVQVIPLKMAVPLMLIFDLTSGLLLGMRNRKVVDRKELLRLIPFMLAGMAIGVIALVKVQERLLLLLLGAFILAYSAWSLLLKKEPTPLSARWSAPLGMVGGVFTALFGTGGPIYTIYLARRLDDKAVLRATISALIFVTGFSRLVLFSTAGFYKQESLLWLAAILLPCSLLGLFLGNRLHSKLPAHRVVQVIWAILILGGTSLILRNW